MLYGKKLKNSIQINQKIAMKRIIRLIIILSFLGCVSLEAQIIRTKLDVAAGFSFREYLHAGIRYQYLDITQLGLFIGTDGGLFPEIVRTYSADHLIHFGNTSFLSNRPVWYARQGFTYKTSTESDRIYKFSYINLALGRDFSINNWLGVNADIGCIIQVREKMEYKDPSLEPWYRTNWYWLPLFRIQLYYSF
jgi:hypothetical protein